MLSKTALVRKHCFHKAKIDPKRPTVANSPEWAFLESLRAPLAYNSKDSYSHLSWGGPGTLSTSAYFVA